MVKASATEKRVLKKAKGRIFNVSDQKVALDKYNAVRKALGAEGSLKQPYLFGSYSDGNSKLGKSDKMYIGGVTYAPALTVKQWVQDSTLEERKAVLKALNMPGFHTFFDTFSTANMCAKSTKGCRKVCNLRTSGRMGMENKALANSGQKWYSGTIVRAQLARTLLFLAEPQAAVDLAVACVERTAAVAKKKNIKARWRLAVSDDIQWELVAPIILTKAKELDVKVYGYTKHDAVNRPGNKDMILVRSASERTKIDDIEDFIKNQNNVAVVFDAKRGEELPSTWLGMPVVDGDLHDDRTVEPDGVIVGLRAKGDAVGSKSKFIFPVDQDKAKKRRELELV